jgi:two-component system, cell cycle response regulator
VEKSTPTSSTLTGPRYASEVDSSGDVRPSILLVEDEPTSRLMTARQLTRAGYQVQVASNGTEALAMLQKTFFAMMLTDWDMPGIDGVALCKAVRAMPLEGYVYIVLLTARRGKANIIEGLAAGADDYLTKPPDDSELQARLNTGLRILKLEQSLRAANHRIRLLSITDSLTSTFNRHHLMERLPREIERARHDCHSLSVVLCDVDHFKRVNDTHGHHAGDAVLKGFAQLLADCVRRDGDWVVRYGGEEFLIVLPDARLEDAMVAAEQMRKAISAYPFVISGATLHVTASFGVAGLDPATLQEGDGVDRLIDCADRCLFRSKNGGRDRVTGELFS